jgi:outer membrane protein assembly factor BamB
MALAAIAIGQTADKVDVLTQHNDLARTGTNLRETVLTPESVAPDRFGMIFKYVVDDQLYTQPLVATGVEIRGGRHDVVYATTVNNSVYAFDANDAGSGKPLWHVNFGTPADLHDADFGCTDINGNMSIIGTPVIKAEKTALYVVALTKSGGRFEQRLHSLDLATGADLPRSPVTIEAPGFDPLMQNQRPALLLANGTVYIGYASHCDKEPYHGFLLAYDADSLRQTAVFNSSPGGEGASIWQSGQAPAVDAQGNLYVVTGNGSWNGTTQLSESFLKLDPQLHLLDWFTPTNHEQLDKDDNDLNSSGATLIPGTNVVLGGGKEGKIYLLDKDKLGHLGDENALEHFQATGSHLHSIVYWKSAKSGELLYLWGQRDKARVYRFEAKGLLNPTPWITRPEINEGHPGAMISLSANGGREGILWAAIHATGDSWHESRPGVLHAYDADDIRHELWNSLANRARDDCGEYSKMAPPTIANGKVYLASFGAANTGTGQMCVYGLLPHGRPPAAPGKVEAAIRGRFVDLSWTPVDGAVSYRLEKMQGGAFHTIAWGLTQPAFTEAAAEKGSVSYRVIAVDANGVGEPSTAATVTIHVAPVARMVMH